METVLAQFQLKVLYVKPRVVSVFAAVAGLFALLHTSLYINAKALRSKLILCIIVQYIEKHISAGTLEVMGGQLMSSVQKLDPTDVVDVTDGIDILFCYCG